MRQIVIDELSKEEQAKVEKHLQHAAKPGSIEGVFWLAVPDDLLAAAQQGHSECGPFFFTIELTEQAVSFELLVRGQSSLHCSCIAFATPAQRDFLLRFMDKMVEKEKIGS